MANCAGPTDTTLRPWLAILIVMTSIIGIVLASIIAIVFAPAADRPDMTRLIFASLLPLFGTWVGTVMAFYFAKENLAAATESTARLTGAFQRTTPVADAMVPKAQIVSFDLTVSQDAGNVPLYDLQAKMDASGKHRLPILKSDGSLVYVVHQSEVAQFAAQNSANPHDRSFVATIADLLKVDALAKAVRAFAFVAPAIHSVPLVPAWPTLPAARTSSQRRPASPRILSWGGSRTRISRPSPSGARADAERGRAVSGPWVPGRSIRHIRGRGISSARPDGQVRRQPPPR